jgi:hypothetical protein
MATMMIQRTALHYDRLGYWFDEPAGEKYLARI